MTNATHTLGGPSSPSIREEVRINTEAVCRYFAPDLFLTPAEAREHMARHLAAWRPGRRGGGTTVQQIARLYSSDAGFLQAVDWDAVSRSTGHW
jgi:hypothetical protein